MRKLGVLPLSLLLATASCEQSFEFGLVGDGRTSTKFSCHSGSDPSATPLKRLAGSEYANTLSQLLSTYSVATHDAIMTEMEPALQMLPTDSSSHFSIMDGQVTQGHVDSYFNIAKAFAESVTASGARITTFAGACAAVALPTAACINDFISTFGRRAFRRPLSASQVSDLKTFYDSRATPLRDLIIRMLLSPQFLYRVEVYGTPVDGRDDFFDLDDYELASRLSYTYWQSMPDDTLLDMAAAGDLSDDAGYALAVDYVLETRKSLSRVVGLSFFRQWLKVDSAAQINPGATAAFATFAPTVVGNEAPLRQAMIQELNTLLDVLVWDEDSSVNDLLTTRDSFTQSPLLASLYGVPVWGGTGPRPQFATSERNGVLTRAGLLSSGTHTTTPIHRGAVIRRDLMCEGLALPSDLPPGATTPPAPDPNATTRQRWEAKTSDVFCQSCHTKINSVGFLLDQYDGIGRRRTHEQIINANGTLGNSYLIDAVVQPKIIGGDSTSTDNPDELVAKISESQKFHACMVRNYFRYAFRRMESNLKDGCTLQEMLGHVSSEENGDSIKGMLREMARSKTFKRIKIDP